MLGMMTRCSRTYLLVFLALSIAGTAGLLRYGNPQWHRYIFMFQAFVYPGEPDRLILPKVSDYDAAMASPSLVRLPSRYTGIWRQWDEKGRLQSHETYVDGLLEGEAYSWFNSGDHWGRNLYWYRAYRKGRPVGISLGCGFWGGYTQGYYINGKRHGRFHTKNSRGESWIVYIAGEPVFKNHPIEEEEEPEEEPEPEEEVPINQQPTQPNAEKN